jgi:hypothetical protein
MRQYRDSPDLKELRNAPSWCILLSPLPAGAFRLYTWAIWLKPCLNDALTRDANVTCRLVSISISILSYPSASYTHYCILSTLNYNWYDLQYRRHGQY